MHLSGEDQLHPQRLNSLELRPHWIDIHYEKKDVDNYQDTKNFSRNVDYLKEKSTIANRHYFRGAPKDQIFDTRMFCVFGKE